VHIGANRSASAMRHSGLPLPQTHHSAAQASIRSASAAAFSLAAAMSDGVANDPPVLRMDPRSSIPSAFALSRLPARVVLEHRRTQTQKKSFLRSFAVRAIGNTNPWLRVQRV
jgi:hypothetical protein